MIRLEKPYPICFCLTVSLIIIFVLFDCRRDEKDRLQRPNFLIILADDLTFRGVGYNNEFLKTSNLDELANKGTVFNHAYISTPICAASRTSILTGLYPQTNGTVDLDENSFLKNVVKEQKFQTLPQLLNEAGYSTWFNGKSHLGAPGNYGVRFGEETYDFKDGRTFRDAFRFVEEIASSEEHHPFFLWVAVRQPHIPLHTEEEWLDLYDTNEITLDENFEIIPPLVSFYNQGLPGENYYRESEFTDNYKNFPAGPPRSPEIVKEFSKAYYATISHLDEQLGSLIRQLDSKGLMKNI